jgi:hypothetical protein
MFEIVSPVRTQFENLRVYQLAEEIADLAWEIVIKWAYLPQVTVGKQLIDSADSIGANTCPVK